MKVNNCKTCDYKQHGGECHCYMFSKEPEYACMQHTGRQIDRFITDIQIFLAKQEPLTDQS